VGAGVNGMWYMRVVMNSVNTSIAIDSDSGVTRGFHFYAVSTRHEIESSLDIPNTYLLTSSSFLLSSCLSAFLPQAKKLPRLTLCL